MKKTQEIVGEMTTDSSIGESTAFPSVFQQISHRVRTVIGDGGLRRERRAQEGPNNKEEKG